MNVSLKKKHLVEKIRKFGPCSKASKIVGLVTTAYYKKKRRKTRRRTYQKSVLPK